MGRLALGVLLAACACEDVAAHPSSGPVAGKRKAETLKIAEPVFAAGVQSGWHDYGWAPRNLGPGHAAQLDFSGKGGWIVAHPGLKGRYGGLVFRFKAPPELGDFLEVRLDSTGSNVFPRVPIDADHRRDLPDGWSEVYVPMQELNPNQWSFDRMVFRAHRNLTAPGIELEGIGLTEYVPGAQQNAQAYTSLREAGMKVDCLAPTHLISPAVYGIAFDPRLDGREMHQWQLGAGARRWGGNSSTRYNWELGNAWNTANDWFFRNVNYTDIPSFTYRRFLDDDLERQVKTALTVPIMGWVAKDTTSYSFPQSVYGPERRSDPSRDDAGDGYSKAGKPLPPGPPTRSSVALTPASIGKWVATIRDQDARRKMRSVDMYILDNEPALWSSTHRDVHPQPTGYDELMERTLSYGSAVRKADPDAVIAGPAEWGWANYFYSAIDTSAGFGMRPDRRAHDNIPLIAWYLKKLKEHEEQTGERLLDVVDLHFYPQGKGLQIGKEGAIDEDTNARRIRSTRSLWDPTYVDESWIGEPIELIPRLRKLIAQNYPGRGISIGEYNFGAEEHISGGLALAEALGRFGQAALDAAFYWTYPAKDSHAFWAFRAYRNFDGKGGRFQDLSVPTEAARDSSLFASRDASGKKLVLVTLNLSQTSAIHASIDLTTCGAVKKQRVLIDTAEAPGLLELPPATLDHGTLATVMPPYSFSVIDLEMDPKGALH